MSIVDGRPPTLAERFEAAVRGGETALAELRCRFSELRSLQQDYAGLATILENSGAFPQQAGAVRALVAGDFRVREWTEGIGQVLDLAAQLHAPMVETEEAARALATESRS